MRGALISIEFYGRISIDFRDAIMLVNRREFKLAILKWLTEGV